MDTDIASNGDLLSGAHSALMQAVKNGTGVTLTGVALSMEGGAASVTIVRDEERQPLAVEMTADLVNEWATHMVVRLIEAKPKFEPTGGTAGGWGNPVLAQNLGIIPSGGKHPYWRGLASNDLWLARGAARAARREAAIKENGGYQLDAALIKDSDISTSGVKDIKDLCKQVFPSARKAASALNRAVYGPEWHEEDKAARKEAAKSVIVNARTGEAAVAPKATEPKAAAATPSVPANVTKAALINRAMMLGVPVKQSWTKAAISEAIEGQMSALREAGIIN